MSSRALAPPNVFLDIISWNRLGQTAIQQWRDSGLVAFNYTTLYGYISWGSKLFTASELSDRVFVADKCTHTSDSPSSIVPWRMFALFLLAESWGV